MPETDANAAIAVAGGGGAAEGQAQAPPALNNMWTIMKGLVTRMVIVYAISSLVRNWQGPQVCPKLTN